MRSWARSLAIIAASLLASSLAAQGVDYTDYRHHTVHFPLGDRSFADEVVSYAMGHPDPKPESSRDPRAALGVPDYVDKTHSGFVSLGCGGTLVVRFTDNALVDVDGPDLWVFEVGPAVEPTDVAISRDGKEWIDVGKISGTHRGPHRQRRHRRREPEAFARSRERGARLPAEGGRAQRHDRDRRLRRDAAGGHERHAGGTGEKSEGGDSGAARALAVALTNCAM